MSISMEIISCSQSLDMYGEPDQHEAYSLSGHVSITLSSSSSFFDRGRTVRALLQSLTITFEGQTELVSEETGYTAFRLCSIFKELVTEEPIELSNEEIEDSCVWNVVFNLNIPGWLPASAAFGESGGGTRYTLYASATIDCVDDDSSRTWFSALCAPFRAQLRTVKAESTIQLNRFAINPSSIASSSDSLFPQTYFAISAQPEQIDEGSDFPRDILSKIQVQISTPVCVGIEEGALPFTLRLSTDQLPEDDCKRLRTTDFSVEVEQSERYRTSPQPSYITQYPVPPKSEQPPRKPLRNAHPVHALYDVGLTAAQPPDRVLSRSFSLLPEDACGMYKVAGDGYIFTHETEAGRATTWFSLQTSVPLDCSLPPKDERSDDWKYQRSARPTSQSPFLNVSHRLYVTVTCTYDIVPGQEPQRAVERLRFHVPLRFVHVQPAVQCEPVSPATPNGQEEPVAETISIVNLPVPSVPYSHSLPAYSQLFYSNGDRKIDYSIPLPLYTPRSSDNNIDVLKTLSSLDHVVEEVDVV